MNVAARSLLRNLAQEKSGAERIEPLESMFKSYASREDLDGFERDELNRAVKTGRIDPADYETVHDKYLECMAMQDMMSTTPRCPMGFIRVQRP